MEGEEGDGKECDETVDAGALVRGEDFPPFDGAVGKDHGDVERDDGGEDMIKIRNRDHVGNFGWGDTVFCLWGLSH